MINHSFDTQILNSNSEDKNWENQEEEHNYFMRPKMDIKDTIYNIEPKEIEDSPVSQFPKGAGISLPKLRGPTKIITSKYSLRHAYEPVKEFKRNRNSKANFSDWVKRLKVQSKRGVTNSKVADNELSKRMFTFKFT